jgi:glyoxylase-like metal-dependent hydrolase (beta-lactamase superfamily II)
MDVRGYTVGPVQENCFLVKSNTGSTGFVVDPGDEPERLIGGLEELGIDKVEAILLTHCHFDHVGAVAPLARHTGAPVYCPKLEVPLVQDIMRFVPWDGFGPYEGHDPEETVEGGETLDLAGFAIDVVFTPGHSPGHVTYAIEDEQVLLSGDVLFQGSVGRTDLPGGDWPTLARSIADLLERYPDDTTVLPGHMGVTTLGRERATNPVLAELVQ